VVAINRGEDSLREATSKHGAREVTRSRQMSLLLGNVVASLSSVCGMFLS